MDLTWLGEYTRILIIQNWQCAYNTKYNALRLLEVLVKHWHFNNTLTPCRVTILHAQHRCFKITDSAVVPNLYQLLSVFNYRPCIMKENSEENNVQCTFLTKFQRKVEILEPASWQTPDLLLTNLHQQTLGRLQNTFYNLFYSFNLWNNINLSKYYWSNLLTNKIIMLVSREVFSKALVPLPIRSTRSILFTMVN